MPRKTTEEYLKDAEEIIRKKQAEILGLTRSVRSLERENDTADAIRREIYGLSARSPEPPEWVLREGRAGSRGGPVAIWSDWHWGEVVSRDEVGGVNEFNSRVAKERAKRLVEITIDLCFNHMGRAKQKYPGIVICLGGDMITGDIHDELVATLGDLIEQRRHFGVDLVQCLAAATTEAKG